MVFVAWTILDVVVHGVLLQSAYQASPQLWRAPEQAKAGVLHGVRLVSAVCFALLFGLLVQPKNVKTGALFGVLYGTGQGVGMGFATWAVQPLPGVLAVGWFVAAVVEAVLGGLLLGFVFQETPSATRLSQVGEPDEVGGRGESSSSGPSTPPNEAK